MKRENNTFVSTNPLFRIISCILIGLMLINGNVLSICAISDELNEKSARTIASWNYTSPTTKSANQSSDNSLVSVSNLLDTPSDIDYLSNVDNLFLEEENDKEYVFRYSSEANEGKLKWLCDSVTVYSACPNDRLFILWDYISPEPDQINACKDAFVRLESLGYSLYDSALLVKTQLAGGFSIDESIALHSAYPNAPMRMLQLHLLNNYINRLNDTESAALAKKFFLDGYPAKNIESAISVGKALGISPEKLIIRDEADSLSTSRLSEAEINVLKVYPVNAEVLHSVVSKDVGAIEKIAPSKNITTTNPSQSYISESSASLAQRSTSGDTIKEPLLVPYSTEISELGGVALPSGDVNYTHPLFTIPGRAGLDTELTLIYRSCQSYLLEPQIIIEEVEYEDTIYNVYETIYTIQNDVIIDVKHSTPIASYKSLNDIGNYHTTVATENGASTITEYSILSENDYIERKVLLMNDNIFADQLGLGWSIYNLPYCFEDAEGYMNIYVPGEGWGYAYGSLGDGVLCFDNGYYSFYNGIVYSEYKLEMTTGVSYFFDTDAKLIGQRDVWGNTIQYQYNSNGMLQQIIDTAGRNIAFSYQSSTNSSGIAQRVITITLPDNQTILINQEALSVTEPNRFKITSIRDEAGKVTSFTYERETNDYRYSDTRYEDFDGEEMMTSDFEYIGQQEWILLTVVSYPYNDSIYYQYEENAVTTLAIDESYWRVDFCDLYSGGTLIDYSIDYEYMGPNGNIYIKVNNVGLGYDLYYFDGTVPRIIISHSLDGEYRRVSKLYDSPTRPKLYEDYSVFKNGFIRESWHYDQYGRLEQHTQSNTNAATPGFGEVNYTYTGVYPVPTQITSVSSDGQTITTKQTGQYAVESSAVYVGASDTQLQSISNSKEYSARTYDTYGNCITEKNYLTMPSAAGTGGTYQLREFTYGSYASGSAASLYCTSIKINGTLTDQYSYDIMGREISHTNGIGATTTKAYAADGRISRITHPDSGIETYTYGTTSNYIYHTTTSGGIAQYGYNIIGLPTYVYRNGTTHAQYTYNKYRFLSGTNEIASETYYFGSTYQKKTTHSWSGNKKTSQTYDANDTLLSIVVEKPIETTLTYGGGTVRTTYNGGYDQIEMVEEIVQGINGLLISHKVSVGYPTASERVTAYTYDRWGNKITESITANGQTSTTTYTYDYKNRLISTTNPDGRTATITYDALGNKTSETGFDGVTTTYTYDLRGRLIAQSTPVSASASAQTQYVYDNANRVIQEKQSRQADNGGAIVWITTAYEYDSVGRVTDIYMPAKQVGAEHVHYEYNTSGDLLRAYTGVLTSTTAPSYTDYALVQHTYDVYGRETGITDALGASESYTYNILDKVATAVSRDGKTTAFTYDCFGNELSATVSQNSTVLATRSATYDNFGRMLTQTGDGRTTSYTYNNGLLTSVTETGGTTTSSVSYTYNARGQRTGYTLSIGGITKDSAAYTYDLMGRLSTVVSDGVTTIYTYDNAGRRISESSTGGGFSKGTTYTYNQGGLLTGMTNTSAGTAISTYSYAYNTDGTQRSKTENGTTTTYTYDTTGRLLSETGASNITYAYDARGNRTSMTKDNVTTTYTYNKANQLLTETSQGVTQNYTYDANGSLTTVTSGVDTLKTYTYDAWGRQTGYTEPLNLITATYTYGSDGLRRSKTVGAITTEFVWNDGNMVYDTSSGGTIYRYGATLLSSDNGTATYLYVMNGHGDVAQMLAGTTVVKSYSYDAFGNEIGINTADTNPFRYCAQYFDKESGTIYLRARYYAPGLGRFTQQDAWAYADPSDPASLNLYIYCFNNPVLFVDPYGNDAIWLQYEEEAKEFGHTGLLLQDADNQWHLFYWGTRNPKEAFIGSNELVIDKDNIFEKLGAYNFNRDDLFNDVWTYISETSANPGMHQGISGLLYFDGDFTKSVEYINEVMDGLSDNITDEMNKQYNLYFNNCLQMSVNALLEGTFSEHDAKYKVALGYAQTSLIPNDAYRGMKYFVSNINTYMRKNWFQRFFSSPYCGFINYRNWFY